MQRALGSVLQRLCCCAGAPGSQAGECLPALKPCLAVLGGELPAASVGQTIAECMRWLKQAVRPSTPATDQACQARTRACSCQALANSQTSVRTRAQGRCWAYPCRAAELEAVYHSSPSKHVWSD